MADAAMTDISDAELVSMLNNAKRELFNLRFQLATGQLDNTARIKQVKREVARAKTELRSREIQAAEELTASARSASLRGSATETETPANRARRRSESPGDQAAETQAGDAL